MLGVVVFKNHPQGLYWSSTCMFSTAMLSLRSSRRWPVTADEGHLRRSFGGEFQTQAASRGGAEEMGNVGGSSAGQDVLGQAPIAWVP